jgi:hypothetical protein
MALRFGRFGHDKIKIKITYLIDRCIFKGFFSPPHPFFSILWHKNLVKFLNKFTAWVKFTLEKQISPKFPLSLWEGFPVSSCFWDPSEAVRCRVRTQNTAVLGILRAWCGTWIARTILFRGHYPVYRTTRFLLVKCIAMMLFWVERRLLSHIRFFKMWKLVQKVPSTVDTENWGQVALHIH